MTGRKLGIGLLIWLIASVAHAQAGTLSARRFMLPDHGHFVIQVPSEWKEQVSQPPKRLPPTITLGPSIDKSFQFLITTLWPATKDHAPQSSDQIRSAVKHAAQSASAQAVEKELKIVEFQGRSGSGFYFSATDKAPRPGEYKFLTQGIVRVGELSVSFTILTNEGQEMIVKQALDALKTAVQDGV